MWCQLPIPIIILLVCIYNIIYSITILQNRQGTYIKDISAIHNETAMTILENSTTLDNESAKTNLENVTTTLDNESAKAILENVTTLDKFEGLPPGNSS